MPSLHRSHSVIGFTVIAIALRRQFISHCLPTLGPHSALCLLERVNKRVLSQLVENYVLDRAGGRSKESWCSMHARVFFNPST